MADYHLEKEEKDEKLKEFVDKSLETVGSVAKKLGDTAKYSATIIGNSKIAQGAAAVSTEAARFAVDRTFEALERATDPNYGAFWEPRIDRFSMMPWYERQLVEETCELPLTASPLTEILQLKSDESGTVWSRTTTLNGKEEDAAEWQVIAEDGLPEGELARRRGGNMSPQVKEAESDSEMDQSDYDRATAYIGAPPLWTESTSCASCQRMFGITRYRHHCRSCGGSFCHTHSSHSIALPRLGFLTPVRCCDQCFEALSAVELNQRNEWRLARIEAYESGSLIPYFEVAVDSHMHKARRLLEGTICLVKKVPLGASATITVEVMDILWKYGPPGIAGLVLRREFIEAAELLRKVSDLEESWPCSAPQLMASLFYLLALKRGERGSNPDAEAKEHALCLSVSDAELRWVLSVAPFALHFCYMSNACEMQLRAAQRGFGLIFTKSEALPSQPAFCLFARPGNKVYECEDGNVQREPSWWRKGACAVLAIRGTSDIYDVVTDIRTNPVPFPLSEVSEDEGLPAGWTGGFDGLSKTVAVQGMASAAMWLLNEVGESLRRLAATGHAIVLTGHSLGGGVASLLGILLKQSMPDAQIRVVTFGCPACMDEELATQAASFTTSVVLHDDIVPRLSPRSVRSLVADLLKNRERMTTLWRGDMDAVFGRAKTLWIPRWRDSFLRQDKPFDRPAKGLLSPSHVDSRSNRTRPLGMASDLHNGALLRSKFILANSGVKEESDMLDLNADNVEDVLQSGLDRRNKSVLSVDTFGREKQTEDTKSVPMVAGDEVMAWGIVRKGEQDILKEDLSNSIIVDEGDEVASWYPGFLVSMDKSGCEVKFDNPDVFPALQGFNKLPPHLVHKVCNTEVDALYQEEDELDDFQKELSPIIIDEVSLPELRVPGNVLHLWSQRGVFRVSHVNCGSPVLTNFKLYGNMLTDHLAVNYFDALAEALDVLSAPCSPPEWVPFKASNKCQCCRATFSWSATGTSGATTSREKHNCRGTCTNIHIPNPSLHYTPSLCESLLRVCSSSFPSKGCGALVCGPCSENRRTVPRIGLNTKVRVCDNCFFDASALSQQPPKQPLQASTTSVVQEAIEASDNREKTRSSHTPNGVSSYLPSGRPLGGSAKLGAVEQSSGTRAQGMKPLEVIDEVNGGQNGDNNDSEEEESGRNDDKQEVEEEENGGEQAHDEEENQMHGTEEEEAAKIEEGVEEEEEEEEEDGDDEEEEWQRECQEQQRQGVEVVEEKADDEDVVLSYCGTQETMDVVSDSKTENLIDSEELDQSSNKALVESGFSDDEVEEVLAAFRMDVSAESPVGLRKRNISK